MAVEVAMAGKVSVLLAVMGRAAAPLAAAGMVVVESAAAERAAAEMYRFSSVDCCSH